MDFAYGPRFEVETPRPSALAPHRGDAVPGGSVGLTFGRIFRPGISVFAVGRLPLVLTGQGSAGAGVGLERPVASGWHLFGALEGGWSWLSCATELEDCSTTPTYSGPWARTEVEARYRLVEGLKASSSRLSKPGVSRRGDVYLSCGAGFDFVAASYDENGDLTPPQPAIHGVRLGVDGVLGFGFLWW